MVSSRMPWFEEAWIPGGPNWDALWKLAEGQGGLFTNAEARTCGIRRSLLSYYARRNVFERVHRGVYRLRWPPPGPFDRIRAAWVFAGRHRAVVSHESALFLWNLLDTEPTTVHLTLPRVRRGRVPTREVALARGVRIHVPRQWLNEHEIGWRNGIQVTSPERAVLDTARTLDIEGIVRRAAIRGQIDDEGLLRQARARGGYMGRRVEGALDPLDQLESASTAIASIR